LDERRSDERRDDEVVIQTNNNIKAPLEKVSLIYRNYIMPFIENGDVINHELMVSTLNKMNNCDVIKVSDLQRFLGIEKSKVNNILDTLLERSMVSLQYHGQYRLKPELKSIIELDRDRVVAEIEKSQ
jgi:hypothetical protein